MEKDDGETCRKRMKQTKEINEDEDGGRATQELAEGDTEASVVASEEMELHINGVLERIERFTQLVSELLEVGKTLFKDLSDQFEERMINIHREQIEKWQEEIKELRMLDVSNEEANTLLLNAKQLLQNIHGDT